MTPVSERVERYPAWREAPGTGLSASAVRALRTFAAFAADEGARHVTAEPFPLWRERYGSAGRKSRSYGLSHVRTFAAWLQALDPGTEVPPKDPVPADRSRPRPYIHSDREIADIIGAASRLRSPKGRGLRAATCVTPFGLLAVTGLRVGEALRLEDGDFDARAATLTVRHAKNRAGRALPLAPCTVERLEAYRSMRDGSVARRARNLFLGESGRPVAGRTAAAPFRRCAVIAGVHGTPAGGGHGRPPRLHDMRHNSGIFLLPPFHSEVQHPMWVNAS